MKTCRTAGGRAPLLADAPQNGAEQQREDAREHEARAVIGHVAPVALPELPEDERKLPRGRLRVARAKLQRLGARRRLAQLRDEALVAPARQAAAAPVSARTPRIVLRYTPAWGFRPHLALIHIPSPCFLQIAAVPKELPMPYTLPRPTSRPRPALHAQAHAGRHAAALAMLTQLSMARAATAAPLAALPGAAGAGRTGTAGCCGTPRQSRRRCCPPSPACSPAHPQSSYIFIPHPAQPPWSNTPHSQTAGHAPHAPAWLQCMASEIVLCRSHSQEAAYRTAASQQVRRQQQVHRMRGLRMCLQC
jgi:hypothetical protein